MTFLSPIAEDAAKVLSYIEKYEKAINDIEPFFTLEGRKLVEICQNIPKKIVEFKRYAAELKSIQDLLELRRDEHEGKKWKGLNEHNKRQLSTKDIQQYIKGDAEFVSLSELMLEIGFLRSNVNAVIEALDTMNWQVGHIAKVYIASLSEMVL